MPTLNWIGKDKVLTHHQDVPYRILNAEYSFPENQKSAIQSPQSEDGNLIIHGDNLAALKSLLPRYEGRVKCIYIDPPYNTGNEGWVYNDKVNDPKILKWLDEVVGREGEDLSRHDKWLCMMYPRLRLLHKLLSPDGAIFISIDDNEQANLKLAMDEIFGQNNFITTLIWHKMDSPKNTAIHFSEDHEYVLVYAKNGSVWRPKKLERTEAMVARYKNPDDDPRGPWLLSDLAARNVYSLGRYSIETKNGKVIDGPPAGSYWRVSREKFDELDRDNRIWWGKTGDNRPGIKRFLSEVQQGVVPQTLWHWKDVGSTRNSKQELSKVLSATSNSELFITPKPASLIERILQIASGKDSIILDSFAGSGTTAHAVLNLNKADGGNRKFILVEMEDYAERITAERVKRVISGYGDKEGTGGTFTYCTIGEPLFHPNNTLNEAIGAARIREYVWYTETAEPMQHAKGNMQNGEVENAYYLGRKDDTGYYFYYEPEALTTLDHDFLGTITQPAGTYVIYADNCLLSKAFMQQKGIIFKKIPRDITRF